MIYGDLRIAGFPTSSSGLMLQKWIVRYFWPITEVPLRTSTVVAGAGLAFRANKAKGKVRANFLVMALTSSSGQAGTITCFNLWSVL
jgi:hypothetical protein